MLECATNWEYLNINDTQIDETEYQVIHCNNQILK